MCAPRFETIGIPGYQSWLGGRAVVILRPLNVCTFLFNVYIFTGKPLMGAVRGRDQVNKINVYAERSKVTLCRRRILFFIYTYYFIFPPLTHWLTIGICIIFKKTNTYKYMECMENEGWWGVAYFSSWIEVEESLLKSAPSSPLTTHLFL